MGVHERNLQLKQDIASSIPDFEAKATKAWSEILEKLETVTNEIIAGGSDYLPSVDHADLNRLSSDQLALLKQRGSFIVRNVVPRDGARAWKSGLEDFVRANPNAEGTPVDNPQYFQLFYTKPQLQARAHPNVLATETWCNNLWAGAESTPPSEQLDLNTPLTYVDRFRIRQPGFAWSAHPPHMDGGSIERWLDPGYRSVFEKVLDGRWAEYDPYFLKGRLGARSSAAGLPNQASVFRTFQGWLALSESGPQGGTLQVFPDIALGTAYIMLRPFFTPTAADGVAEVNGVADWTFGTLLVARRLPHADAGQKTCPLPTSQGSAKTHRRAHQAEPDPSSCPPTPILISDSTKP